MSVLTLSGDTVYATRSNIVIPVLENRSAAQVALDAVARIKDTVPAATAITFTAPVKTTT